MSPKLFMPLLPKLAALALAPLVAIVFTGPVLAQEQVLNLYSARHYQTDEALYRDFSRSTGIKINRVDADDAGILARLKAEGQASPADVILLVDAARLVKGQNEGLFAPVKSAVLDTAIPSAYRAQANAEGTAWFGFSTRARLIVYDKSRVKRSEVDSYLKLADPVNKGRLCVRSGSHPYNLSLFGAMLETLGEQKTNAWLSGLVANMARPPRGGDTDQIKGVASGECQVALVNSYYLARLMRSAEASDQAVVQKLGMVFPGKEQGGTHVNIAGGAMARYAKNRANAIKFLEYLASPSAQRYFAEGNNEWPVVAGVATANPALREMSGGAFDEQTVPLAAVAAQQMRVQQMLDRVGFK